MGTLKAAAFLAEVLQVHPGPIIAETLASYIWYINARMVLLSSSQSVLFQIKEMFFPGKRFSCLFILSIAMLTAEA